MSGYHEENTADGEALTVLAKPFVRQDLARALRANREQG